MLKAVCFLITATQIGSTFGSRYCSEDHQEKFVIENENTGFVWESISRDYKMSNWANKNSQLFTLKPQNKSGYFKIFNGDTIMRRICIYNGTKYTTWKLNVHGVTRIEAELPGLILYQRNGSIHCKLSEEDTVNDKWLFIRQSKKINMKYVIENKKNGQVLEEIEGTLKMKKWKKADSQLWTLKPQNKSGYSIVNVASGRTLTYRNNGTDYQTWKLNKTRGYARIQIKSPNVFLVRKNGKPMYVRFKQSDGSDRWFLTDYETKKNRMKLKPIYVEGYKERFVIENLETGMVWENVSNNYQMAEWDNSASQLWKVEPRNKSGYYGIFNSTSRISIVCPVNGTKHKSWKINNHNATRIEAENEENFIFWYQKNNSLFCSAFDRGGGSDEWLFIEQSRKVRMRYVIENKKTGMILEETKETLEMEKWRNRTSQLWTLRPTNKSGYSIVNVKSGKVLTYLKDGQEYWTWKLHTRGETRIRTEHPNVLLAHKSGRPVYVEFEQNDKSDKWLLIDYESRKKKPTQEPIYVNAYQAKFAIKNKKTGKVLDGTRKYADVKTWENKISQLWTIEPHGKSGHFLIRNAKNQGFLAYNNNSTESLAWNLNINGETRIQVEDSNVVLVDRGDKVEFIGPQIDESDKWVLVEQEW